MECVILIGLPASGKTTFYLERFAGTHEHVSKDAMRHNRQPQRRQNELIDAALAAGRSVAVDNTNPTAADRAAIIAIARRHGAEVAGYFFPTEAADALRRNRAREGRNRVPAVAIFAARKRLERPAYEEGFDRLFTVAVNEEARSFDVAPQPR
ncbi:MAG TPA: AAA family ATPase [Vicinamibacterales bacterium]|nr:AAA family ATPase [Vicinamibacterales bacterium]